MKINYNCGHVGLLNHLIISLRQRNIPISWSCNTCRLLLKALNKLLLLSFELEKIIVVLYYRTIPRRFMHNNVWYTMFIIKTMVCKNNSLSVPSAKRKLTDKRKRAYFFFYELKKWAYL